MATIQTLEPFLQNPSRVSWRQLCDGIDALPDGIFTEEIAAPWREQLSLWPEHYRSLPGRWLRRLFDGESPRGLSLVSSIDATIFDTPRRFPFSWANNEELRFVTSLRLYDETMRDQGALALSRSVTLTHLHTLLLSPNMTDVGAFALAASPHLSGLRSLSLNRDRVGASGLSALLSSPYLSSLQALYLGRNPLDDAAIHVLCRNTLVLTKLDLDYTGLTDDGVVQLCDSGMLQNVTELNLSNNQLGVVACRALASSNFLQQLEVLFLHGCSLTDECVEILLSSKALRSLKNLAMSNNKLNERGLEAIENCSFLSSLTELDVCHNPLSIQNAEERLRASSNLQSLKRLCV